MAANSNVLFTLPAEFLPVNNTDMVSEEQSFNSVAKQINKP